jgi:hypothetical protein
VSCDGVAASTEQPDLPALVGGKARVLAEEAVDVDGLPAQQAIEEFVERAQGFGGFG